MLNSRWTDSRALGNALAVVAVILVVGLLSFLVYESRSVSTEYYVSHVERTRALESTDTDLNAAIAGMREAFEAGREVPTSIDVSIERLREHNQTLQALTDMPRQLPALQALLDKYDASLERWLTNSAAFVSRQNAHAVALVALQENSPTLVRQLRSRGLSSQSQNAFALALNTIEHATGQGSVDTTMLRNRIASLQADTALQTSAPDAAKEFFTTVNTLVEGRMGANLMLTMIENGAVSRDLAALESGLVAANTSTASRADTARVLLAVSAVLLLCGAGFAIFRLQSSYRELNASNKALQDSNENLELRVGERTEQLESAYDDLKDSQAQLIHAEKMSSLGEMVAGVSHEINTPLWYLMNNASVIEERLEVVDELCDAAKIVVTELLAGKKKGENMRRGLTSLHKLVEAGIKDDVEEARRLVVDSISGLDELATLAQGLKDFSRKDRAQFAPFNVNDGLDKSLIIVKNRLKDRIKVHKYYDSDIPLVHCSPSQINQIFLNLLSNSADAIVGTGDVVLQTQQDGGNVVVSISDTGPGIPADVLPRVRDPFFTTKEVGKGTGLGLSIVDRIVTEHNGEMLIDSVPGRGTTISIVLPIAQNNDAFIDPERQIDLPAPLVKIDPLGGESKQPSVVKRSRKTGRTAKLSRSEGCR